MADVGKSLEQAPLAQMVEKLGVAIANAQMALDRNSIDLAVMLADVENGIELGDRKRSLLELGFTPTFYQLTETTIEVKMSFSTAQSSEFSIGAQVGVNVGFFAASVNASYSQKYSFDAQASSSLKSRIVTVPPPTIFHDLLRSLAAAAATDG